LIILKPEINFRTISSKERGEGIIMELMEESLENHLKNKRNAFTAEEYESTMIPISFMLNWLRKLFLSNFSRRRLIYFSLLFLIFLKTSERCTASGMVFLQSQKVVHRDLRTVRSCEAVEQS